MLQLRNAQGPRARRLIGRTLLASALLTAVAALPAAAAAPQSPAIAQTPATATAPARSETGAPAYQQVAHFYGAYIDAVTAENGGRLATDLRNFYLTRQLRERLSTWEQRNHADGVLRAQNTPLAFRVTPGDSAAGHTWSTVRLTWSTGKHPTYSYLTVRSDLNTGKISGIGD
ncbi:hypothetical protein OHU11_28090 [Streptomyces sp. NBC_00257]|uniref:hypothetical protein n=1 Tax=unclassified Streptomyces TaxID=2593676 RepID=UPI0022526B84|nr:MULTISPECIES: hypothetical protein [unclassified Streptomyces]WTB54431.1 hypothetical protein OG832_15275 [Streptomyces sp. NBC_00826]WTH92682.1 hypothetical protein OIC43_28405 [Streptomyces sp. NBC_00825]WTI01413.1 hypothetical protein OHA23_28385 [Streptomyces sp. NBC_00822]MCX4866998.1 hypothetical protein [Streptomyces sp. NBC_00906]MCX4898236.1 hypothetical protein [Streptomyces sp. NBC_00892]